VSITTSAGYDAAGNQTRLTDGNNHPTVYTYNSLGLPEKTIEPSTTAYPNLADRTWQASYDAGGLPVTLAEPGGVTRSATYDELGRLTLETGSGTSVTGAARSKGYDLAGNLTSVDSAAGDENFSYNDRNLLLDTTGDFGGSSFTYDEDGRLDGRSDGGTFTNYHYDARSQLVAVDGAATSGTRIYDYDDAGQLTSIDYHGGTGALRTYDHDQLGRVTTDTLTGPSGTLRAQTYGYDNNDNLTTTTVTGTGVAGAGTQTYGYDWANRLTSWTNQANTTTAYGWDGAGNRTSADGVTATFDARNRLTNDGTATYTYTARGTRSTHTAASTVTTTAFDAFDRLISTTVGSTTTSYTYDALDRIATRTHGGTYDFLYNGLEREPSTDGTSAFARSPDGSLIGAGTGSGDWVTLDDAHGDIVAAFTTDGAGLTETRNYDPFGTPRSPVSTDLQIGYQGNWTDPDTHLVAAQARWYDPTTATFLTRDTYPLPWTGTPADNRYTYAAANPVSHNDPTGAVLDGAPGASASTVAASQQAAVNAQKAVNAQNVANAAQKQAAAQAAANKAREEAEFWAGVNAALAFQEAERKRQEEAAFWAGVNAALAFQEADRQRAAQDAANQAAQQAAQNAAAQAAAQRERDQAAQIATQQAANQAAQIAAQQSINQSAQVAAQQAAHQSAVQSAQDAQDRGAVVAAKPVEPSVSSPGIQNVIDIPKLGRLPIDPPDGGGPSWDCGDQLVAAHGGFCGSGKPAEPRSTNPVGPIWVKCGALRVTNNPGLSCAADGEGLLAQDGLLPNHGYDSLVNRVVGDALEDCNSFDGATPVLLADGTSEKISKIQIGDQVLATDPDTGTTTPRSVTSIIIGYGDKQLVDITIGTDRGPATLTSTAGHPIWDATTHTWTTADHLIPGHKIEEPDGATAIVTNLHRRHAIQAVYNLTIDTIHTYYVKAGDAAVLVHNAKCSTSGTNPYARLGQRVHKDFSDILDTYGAVGYRGEFRLGSGRRPDGGFTDPATGVEIPVELKPDNPSKIREGIRDLTRYEDEMILPRGVGQLWVYRVNPETGALIFIRIR